MPSWKLLDTGANRASYNMHLDEELLRQAQGGDPIPVLRFYAWDPPAISVGRFQDIDRAVNSEACKRHGFDVVRRITGGRAVLHRSELTYSIVARTDNPLFPPDVLGTYKVIATGLVAGLRQLGLPAEIVSRESRHSALVKKKSKDPACFSSPSWHEIVVNNRKIIGSAQRRVSGAFLQHGSILIECDPELEAEVIPGGNTRDVVTGIQTSLGREIPLQEVRKAFADGFSQSLGIDFFEY